MTGILLTLARRHLTRSATTGAAALVAVAFVVATLAVSASFIRTLETQAAAPYVAADVYARAFSGDEQGGVSAGPGTGLTDDAVDAVAALPQVDAVAVEAFTTVRGSAREDDLLSVQALAEDPALRWHELTAGRWPQAPDEVLSDDPDEVGQRLTWFAFSWDATAERDARPIEVTVVGAVDPGGFAGAGDSYAVPLATFAQLDESEWTGLLVAGEGDDLIEAVREAMTAAGVAEPDVVPASDIVEREVAALTGGALEAGLSLQIFTAVTVLVAAMVIATTHGVVMAQRTRELALLSALGSTRRQLVVSGVAEILTVGAIASVLGAAAGVALAAVAVQAIGPSSSVIPVGELVVPTWVVVVGVAVGVLTTLLASLSPLLRATRVLPVAALRPVEATPPSRRWSRARLAVGGLLGAGGLAVLAVAASSGEGTNSSTGIASVAVLASFLGLVVLARPLASVAVVAIDRLVARQLPPAAGIGLAYARRNAHRSGSLTAALLVGITLLATVTAGAASVRASIESSFDDDWSDVTVVADAASTAVVESAVDDVPRVVRTTTLPGTAVTLDVPGDPTGVGYSLGYNTDVAAVAPENRVGVADPPPPGVLQISPQDAAFWGEDLQDGSRMTVTGPDGDLDLALEAIGDRAGPGSLVHPDDLAVLADTPESRIFLEIDADTTMDRDAIVEQITTAVGDADPTATLVVTSLSRESVIRGVDIALAVVLGLFGISVIVAVLGMAGAFALSVYERSRDLALLRGLGMSRRGTAGIVVTEAAALGALAAVVGLAVGTVYGVGAVSASFGRSDLVVDVPGLRMTALVVVTVLAAVLAALLPAWRSSRVTPAAGLTAVT